MVGVSILCFSSGHETERNSRRVIAQHGLDEARAVRVGIVCDGGDGRGELVDESGDLGRGEGEGDFEGGHVEAVEGHEPEVCGVR